MFNSNNLREAFLLAVFLPSAAALAADNPNVDTARSSLVATFKQSGVPVDSPFKKFSGRIVYDPANVTGASAAIEVDTGSFDIGDEEYNAEVRKAQWFDVAKYPKATFKSTAIRSTGATTFVATGTLTVKGKVQTLSIPIAARKTANGIAFEGAFTLSRKAFGLGDPLWEDILEDKVGVRFSLISSSGPKK